ncbi:MAG: hypothetical protein ACI9WU_000347 [Myxococcota bacterium]|jgi:hypothetical protein
MINLSQSRIPSFFFAGRKFTVLGIAALMAGAGCSSDSDDTSAADAAGADTATVSEFAEACEHAAEGPFVPVTATADATGAPDATHEHSLVQVTLLKDAVSGEWIGTVALAPDEAGDFVVYLSSDVTFSVADASGTAVAVEATEQVTDCSEVAVAHTVEMEIGTYHFTFNAGTDGATAPVVGMVVEHGAHDEHAGDEPSGHDG